MALKKLRPMTPGTRHRVAASFDDVTTNVPEKSLVVTLKKSGGRNSNGRLTMRYIGGGHKQKIRIIDFKRDKANVPATVATIEYDPTRSARIALLHYADGAKAYILAPAGLEVGQQIVSGADVAPEVGNALPLAKIPVGTIVHNVEIKPGKGGAIARSAGSFVQLLARENGVATLKMPSGEMRNVLDRCMATVGTVSNADHMNESLGKAGRNRWKGIRPRTRAVAMNPVDHPMGGGEGRASGGHPRSRNGLLAKGKKTRHPNKYSDGLIISRRKK
ncbi:MAG TPA: 50S ribosomal protein L2 [Cyclobacteriaceae bacterium]|nr:50S ribosomal protein L2 [Cyclobacteriaceae bacterium]HMV09671.1 50S ribosomal protein L2 [Cyclobacteriaceae bacterium]HMV89424.1 50S ribosomal protein L2 [Cyclobacteriaceae bacterium]HMX02224.1 50S ribosomal protein L2 [Cyclobacteriaceae bacterium]HMX51235.1 50S ribosomal protein L2 [Cyclobacteriaceae bacterium]